MKEFFSLPHNIVKTLVQTSWISYLYHLVFFGVATFLLLGISLANINVGGIIGFLIVVGSVYVLLTSFLIRLLTGNTGSKKSSGKEAAKKEGKKSEKKEEK